MPARQIALRLPQYPRSLLALGCWFCFATRVLTALHFQVLMTDPSLILCDGCGQPASPEHIARRLQRLEWATRYRPIHLHTLLLGAVSPEEMPIICIRRVNCTPEKRQICLPPLVSLPAGKPADALHTEFQRRGLFLTHVLECPLDGKSQNGTGEQPANAKRDSLLISRLPAMFTRIRRSLETKTTCAYLQLPHACH